MVEMLDFEVLTKVYNVQAVAISMEEVAVMYLKNEVIINEVVTSIYNVHLIANLIFVVVKIVNVKPNNVELKAILVDEIYVNVD